MEDGLRVMRSEDLSAGDGIGWHGGVAAVGAVTKSSSHLASISALATRVAACCRLLQSEGHLNYSGHVSARIPGEDEFLIHPFLNSRARVTSDDILTCDLDGQLTAASRSGQPPREVFIHAEVYRARPDVQAVLHTHAELAAVFSVVAQPLVPIRGAAYRWRTGVPVHPYPSHIDTPAKGRAAAATLGTHNALLLRSHGGVIVAEGIEAVLADAIHFDENARALMQVIALGTYSAPTESELDIIEASYQRSSHVEKVWAYYIDRGLAAGILDPAAI